MQRLTRTLSTLLGSVAVATLTLASCGGDDSLTDAADRPETTTARPRGEAPGAGDDPAAASSASEPTGRLTVDGETWDLTFDVDDLNARCQIVANSASVSGMRTPDGNRVNVDVAEIPQNVAIATYFDDKERPLRRVETGRSSEPPKWSIEGSTIWVKGLWVHSTDRAQPEVEGEVEVTC